MQGMEDIKEKGLTANQIKWIAIFTMLIDHIAWSFVPTNSVLGQIMHVIGRITAPTMCFFIAEGYVHTHNVRKYALRLGIFALISQVPYTFYHTGKIQFLSTADFTEMFNVIYTLLLSLLAIWAWDSIKNKTLRLLTLIGLCVLAMPGDWMCIDVLVTLFFWMYRGSFRDQAVFFSIFTACMVASYMVIMIAMGKPFYTQFFQAGVLLCLPILSRYNGKRGGGKNSKWAFYIFYPLHLFALGLLQMFI
jgi:hypothetical protein